MADPFADAADYFGDDAAPTPPLSPRPALFPAPSAEEVAEAKARKEAAAATPESSPPPPPARKRPKQRGLRVGAWSDEEVAYAERVSDLYRQGKLPNCPDGTTLRSLLATLLNCQPMRISKKYSGEAWAHCCIAFRAEDTTMTSCDRFDASGGSKQRATEPNP